LVVAIASGSFAAPKGGSKSGSTLRSYSLTIPWREGTVEEALQQSATGATIPMVNYKVKSTKDGNVYSGVLVGTSPFKKPATGTTINAVIIPLRFEIGTSVFDPSVANSCDSNVSPLVRFVFSPLSANVPNLTIDGVNVGTTQYINGFRRAEFWGKI